MEKLLKSIMVSSTDNVINKAVSSLTDADQTYQAHFSQKGELFLDLQSAIEIPSFRIHHDIEKPDPDDDYRELLRHVIDVIHSTAPGILNDLTYFFDPAEILRPCFYKMYRIEDSRYMYLLRLDLSYKPADCERLENVSNDRTPPFRCQKLFFEADFIPISQVEKNEESHTTLVVDQVIKQTWIGESGRGYRIQGVWIDQDLTKFFSSLFVPDTVKRYPYYPFACKYRAFCHTPPHFTADDRKKRLPLYHRAAEFIRPVAPQIESLVKRHAFAPDLSLLKDLRSKVPEKWLDSWKTLAVTPYLNDKDMKEFNLDI